jgi:hypothetical protein
LVDDLEDAVRSVLQGWLGNHDEPDSAKIAHFFVDGHCQEFVAVPWLTWLRLVLPSIAIKLMGGKKWENNVDDNITYHNGHDAKNDSDNGVRKKSGQLNDFLEGF